MKTKFNQKFLTLLIFVHKFPEEMNKQAEMFQEHGRQVHRKFWWKNVKVWKLDKIFVSSNVEEFPSV